MDLFPWKVRPQIWNGLIKFAHREVVESLKPKVSGRKINDNGFYEIGIIEEWVNQNTKESK